MAYHRANEITSSANKKTIMPQDVFEALEEIEFGFMRPQLEAEFASVLPNPWPYPPNPFAALGEGACVQRY